MPVRRQLFPGDPEIENATREENIRPVPRIGHSENREFVYHDETTRMSTSSDNEHCTSSRQRNDSVSSETSSWPRDLGLLDINSTSSSNIGGRQPMNRNLKNYATQEADDSPIPKKSKKPPRPFESLFSRSELPVRGQHFPPDPGIRHALRDENKTTVSKICQSKARELVHHDEKTRMSNVEAVGESSRQPEESPIPKKKSRKSSSINKECFEPKTSTSRQADLMELERTERRTRRTPKEDVEQSDEKSTSNEHAFSRPFEALLPRQKLAVCRRLFSPDPKSTESNSDCVESDSSSVKSGARQENLQNTLTVPK